VSAVRRLLVAVVMSGCAGNLDSNMRPAVMNRLDALPGDAEKRDAILNQANTTTGPETPRTPVAHKRERQAETGAAWVAAIIGSAFSKSENVTLGAQGTFDENAIFEDPTSAQPKRKPEPPEKVDAKTLVPWVQLHPAPAN